MCAAASIGKGLRYESTLIVAQADTVSSAAATSAGYVNILVIALSLVPQ